MPFCDQCYESDATVCPRVGDTTKPCCGWAAGSFLTARTADGLYEETVRNCLPEPVRSLEATHIDRIVGYNAPGVGAVGVTTEEQEVIDDFTKLDMSNLPLAASIARKRPALVQNVRDQLNEMLATCSGPNVPRVSAFLDQIRETGKEARELSSKKASTGVEYKQNTYPRATLFQGIVRSLVKGMEVVPDATEMFDPATGKKYVPFEKTTKVDSPENLMYATHLYVSSMEMIKKEAPKVHFDFMRDVTRASAKKGCKFAQAYVDTILRYLDEKRYPSMVAIYKAGEPTRIYLELEASGEFVAKGSSGGGGASKTGRQYIKKFGPVTTPIGGKGAGIIARKCNNFHADPQKPCTAGVPCDEGFPADVCGLCAYEH